MALSTNHQHVSVRTYSGTQLYQFLANDQISLTWGRESRESSRAELTIGSNLPFAQLPNLIPWLHWIDVWDDSGQALHWSGPIIKATKNRKQMVISARDLSAYLSRTRSPLTKRWDAADPATVAEELMKALIEHHNLVSRASVRLDPFGDRFDFALKSDSEMLDKTFDSLVNQGLHWTAMAGTMMLGPQPRRPVASLGEQDFIGDLTLVRDGTAVFNDVLLRGADALSRAVVPMGTLRLQTIVDIDTMFGVSNVDRAVNQYAKYSAAIRDTVDLENGAVLHPDAPVSLDDLIPSSRFVVDAYGMLLNVELTRVDVNLSADTSAVSVNLVVTDDELPELTKMQQQNSISGFSGGGVN